MENYCILFKPIAEWGKQINNSFFIRYNENEWVVSSIKQLCDVRKQVQIEVNLNFMNQGVDILDIESCYIHPDTKIGKGTIIYPNCIIREDVEIGENCSIGPFAQLRPNTKIADNCLIGDFVEIKNTTIDTSTCVSHLTYLGDATVGSNVNFGCGAVTANYDGVNKHHTTIGNRAFIGCNTNMIAPVTIGENAITAAGSTITKNVPDNALAIGRTNQVNKENYRK